MREDSNSESDSGNVRPCELSSARRRMPSTSSAEPSGKQAGGKQVRARGQTYLARRGLQRLDAELAPSYLIMRLAESEVIGKLAGVNSGHGMRCTADA